jgi:hypothetical protein
MAQGAFTNEGFRPFPETGILAILVSVVRKDLLRALHENNGPDWSDGL